MLDTIKIAFMDLLAKPIILRSILSIIISLIICLIIILYVWNLSPNLGYLGSFIRMMFTSFYISFWYKIASTIFIIFYPSIITIIIGFFLDGIANSVEKKHYPNLMSENSEGFLSGSIAGIRMFGWNILILIILTPISLILSNAFISYFLILLATGYVIGKEYYEIVAHRIMSIEDAKYFRKKYHLNYWIYGVASVCLFMIPIINFVTPIFVTCFMVHETQRLIDKYQTI